MSSIPIIDVVPLRDDSPDVSRTKAIRAIAEASEEFGFFQVTNHGLSQGLITAVWDETRRFFDQPRTAKLAISRTRENPRGYYDRELTKNKRDLKEVFDYARAPHPDLPDDHPKNRTPVDGANRWPPALPAFRTAMLGYFDACEALALDLLGAMCEGLGVPAETLHRHFVPTHTSFVRLNYYPLVDPVEGGEATPALGDMALHHHTDAGALTILLQDHVGGLQVLAEDSWLDVPPVSGALVVNVADMMQIWSNGRYRAALHRVQPIVDRPRYSMPFFFNPSYDTDCSPLPVAAAGPPRYRAVNWGEFRKARTDGDYADYGREIQIDDYAIHEGDGALG